MILFVMGVSGCGKSTIGKHLATALKVAFFDGDDFHPESNVTKMQAGTPLDDDDRAGWLSILNKKAVDLVNANEGAVIACSALKKKYRKQLTKGIENTSTFVHLNGSKELIKNRLEERKGHFMPPTLLASQFDALEPLEQGIVVDIENTPDKIIDEIMNQLTKKEFGLIGLGVMGKSLARNLASRGFKLALYNRYSKGNEEQVAERFIKEFEGLKDCSGFEDLQKFVDDQAQPRKIFLMVNAGKVTDIVIDELAPLLSEGDTIIDGGNSYFKDTERRIEELKTKGIHYVGTGVSGGEEGALKGPSIMPSGPREAYDIIAPYLTAIAAKDKNGGDCCTYIGSGGSGHFVKMIHNGIEYAEMQLIAEAYGIMRFVLQMPVKKIADTFEKWNEGKLSSYLLEISYKLLHKKEGKKYMIDLILDKAGNKGTGSWTTEIMAELGEPATLISSALFARFISAFKERRDAYSNAFVFVDKVNTEVNLNDLKNAYALARKVNHQQGFTLIKAAASNYNWEINLSELARIWTNGCIIRSELMEELRESLKNTEDILLSLSQQEMTEQLLALRNVSSLGITAGISIPCHLSAVDFLNAHLHRYPTANMIQAQRDFFGAHTFKRVDDPEGVSHHIEWED